jgi:F420H(2)-dependent quinone reductase
VNRARFAHAQASAFGPVTRALARMQGRVYRRTGGRLGGKYAGKPVLVLITTGRRSGQERSTPVVYMPDGDRWIVAPGNAGLDRPPAWWLNLQARPEAEIVVDGERVAIRARLAEGEERERLMAATADYNPEWVQYREMTTREIPVVVLERA